MARPTPGILHPLVAALLLWGAAGAIPDPALAGSCCGGGSAASLILPKGGKALVDLTGEMEKYDGFWNQDGKHVDDPPGSDLRQYRLTLGTAARLAGDWQAYAALPYVWNRNRYSGNASRSDGLGDATFGVWYEALDERATWKLASARDLVPSVLIGPSVLVPTGISPYDDRTSSFDITGRGFYRFDGNLQVDKTFRPFTASLSLAYGRYLERPVDKEYGRYVEPYRKRLGDRTSASFSIGYLAVLGSKGDMLSGTASIAWLREADGRRDGASDPTGEFRKTSAGVALNWSGTDRDWSVKASYNRAIRSEGWGENFPTTDTCALGVRYVFR
jgi:hypothetical protein